MLVARIGKKQKTQSEAAGPREKQNAVQLIIALSTVFLILSAFYNYLTPITTPKALHSRDGGAANPDEAAHLLYTASIASGQLPVFSRSSPDYEAAQPPLYYCLAAIPYKLSPHNPVVRAHAVRWAATVLGLGLIWLTFLIGRNVLPGQENIASLAAIIVALMPMNISLSSAVSNDTATNLIIGFALYQVIRMLREPARWCIDSVILGTLLAAGIWIKSSTLVLFPTVLAVFAWAVYCGVITRQDSIKSASITLLTAALLSAPWLIRNRLLYGDLFAQTVVFHDLAGRNVSPQTLVAALGEEWYIKTFITWTFESFWGVFDSMNLFLPGQVYGVIAFVAALFLLVGVFTIVRSKPNGVQQAIYVGWLTLVAVTAVGYVQYNAHFFQVQGRYLYPALIPLAIVSAVGAFALVPVRYHKWLQLSCFIGLILLNILSLSMISGRYLV